MDKKMPYQVTFELVLPNLDLVMVTLFLMWLLVGYFQEKLLYFHQHVLFLYDPSFSSPCPIVTDACASGILV